MPFLYMCVCVCALTAMEKYHQHRKRRIKNTVNFLRFVFWGGKNRQFGYFLSWICQRHWLHSGVNHENKTTYLIWLALRHITIICFSVRYLEANAWMIWCACVCVHRCLINRKVLRLIALAPFLLLNVSMCGSVSGRIVDCFTLIFDRLLPGGTSHENQAQSLAKYYFSSLNLHLNRVSFHEMPNVVESIRIFRPALLLGVCTILMLLLLLPLLLLLLWLQFSFAPVDCVRVVWKIGTFSKTIF